MPIEFQLVPEVESVALDHVEQVQKLEESEAKRILSKYREIRHELRDRLDTLPRDKFTAQQLRGVLVQVDLAIDAMNMRLKTEMGSGAQTLAENGLDHLVEEINKWDKTFKAAVVPINLDTVAAATDTRNFLFNNYSTSLDAYSSGIRSQLATQITNAAIEQVSLSDLTQRMGRFFMGEEWRLQMVARTELHNVYNIGKMRGMGDIKESTVPDLKKTLMHPMDARTGADSKKAARLHLIVPIDEPFEYEWNGQERIFMAPPDRPNDRAILIPYREAWGETLSEFSPQRN